jgi:hypothetical protein
MSAAFVAVGQALVDAVTIGLVGDDENTAVGRRGRRGEQERQVKSADGDRIAPMKKDRLI